VYAGCGDLADGVQAWYVGCAVAVGSDAAAQEVFGGRDRDLLGQQVNADPCAGGQYGRESLSEYVGRDGCGVQPDVVGSVAAHRCLDLPGDDVPRGQIGSRVPAGHDPATMHVT
jgi:hypothetical protein